MEYKILRVSAPFSPSKGVEKLAQLVNEAIALGWEPVGGVCQFQATLLQAMIKRR